MTKVLGMRDITVMEAVHQLLGFPLYESNITVVTANLEAFKQLRKKKGQIVFTDSMVELYSSRQKYQSRFPGIIDVNFLEFCQQYRKVNNDIIPRNPDNVAVRTFPKHSSNPQDNQYWLYCKFQLLRYKPWQTNFLSALDVGQVDNSNGWVESWKAFLATELGRLKGIFFKYRLQYFLSLNLPHLVPMSVTMIQNAETYLRENESDVEPLSIDASIDEEPNEPNTIIQDDWMANQMPLDATSADYNLDNTEDGAEYWAQDREHYGSDVLQFISNWLRNTKRDSTSSEQVLDMGSLVDVNTLNEEPKLAYNITVHGHGQRLLRLEGTAGTGKTHLIKAIKQALGLTCCIAAGPTGKAAANVMGKLKKRFFYNKITVYNLIRSNNTQFAILARQLKIRRTQIGHEAKDSTTNICKN